MGIQELKKYQEKAISSLKELSEEKLKVAVDFIEYLQSKEEWEVTWEILANEEMMANIRKAEKDWREGRKENFIPWSQLKRDV